MSEGSDNTSRVVAAFLPTIALLLVVVAGVSVLLFFWGGSLKPPELHSLSLPLVAIVTGLAATFNPCALPALPAFLSYLGQSSPASGLRVRAKSSLWTSLGSLSVVLLIGVLLALLREGAGPFIRINFRWVQLIVGAFLILIASLHLLNQTSRLTLVSALAVHGEKVWRSVMDDRGPHSSYLFGAGFVLVGVG